MRIFSGLISLIVLLLALCFTLANRQSVTITLWPVTEAMEVPAYLLSLGTLFFGILLGGMIIWFNTLRQHLQVRRLRKEIAILNQKILDFQQSVIPPTRLDNFLHPKPKRRFWSLNS